MMFSNIRPHVPDYFSFQQEHKPQNNARFAGGTHLRNINTPLQRQLIQGVLQYCLCLHEVLSVTSNNCSLWFNLNFVAYSAKWLTSAHVTYQRNLQLFHLCRPLTIERSILCLILKSKPFITVVTMYS